MPREPKKNTTGKPRKVPKDIEAKQDPEYTPADFAHDLEKATQREEHPSVPAPKPSRTGGRRPSGGST